MLQIQSETNADTEQDCIEVLGPVKNEPFFQLGPFLVLKNETSTVLLNNKLQCLYSSSKKR
jgi:hypothetical protein